MAAGACGAFLAMRLWEGREGNTADQPVWASFIRDRGTTTLAIGSPYFLDLGKGLYVRDVRVNDGSEHEQLPQFAQLTKNATPASNVYTGVGEALGLERIARTYERNRWPLRVIRSDQLRWQDLKDENVIFLGSFRFRSIESELDTYSQFEFDASTANGKLRNLHPQPGEQNVYTSDYSNGRGMTYGIITLLPGKSPGRRILLLHGIHTWGTQATAEFMTNEDHLRKLEADYGKRTGQKLPEFLQILLSVKLHLGSPLDIEVLSVRDLTSAVAH